MRKLGFVSCHPATQLLYFAAVITLSLLSMNPVIITVSIIMSIILNLYFYNKQQLRLMLCMAVPLFIFITVMNPIVNHRGQMVLFTLFDKSFTLEALLYGAVSGLMLVAVLLWFCAFSAVITNDRLRYLFSGFLPSVSMAITMTLRLIPLLLRRQNEISETLALIAPETQHKGNPLQVIAYKARRLSKIYTVLLGCSMEDSLDTARSMTARGYGTARRGRYEKHRFKARDVIISALMILLFVISIIIYTVCKLNYSFYPEMKPLSALGAEGLYYLIFTVVTVLPLLCDGWEVLRWKY